MLFSILNQYSLVTPVLGVTSYQLVSMEYSPQHSLDIGVFSQGSVISDLGCSAFKEPVFIGSIVAAKADNMNDTTRMRN